MDENDRGQHGNLLHIPLPKGAGSTAYLDALRHKALPFLLESEPNMLLICAGYDALNGDPLATMALQPKDFYTSIRLIIDEFNFPTNRIALGLEGGYNLNMDDGMPAGIVETCAALLTKV